jgi:hypothetical protein
MSNLLKKIILSVLAGLVGICTFSCITTTPVCLTSSNTPLHNKKIAENLGKVEGTSDLFSNGSLILGLWMIGKPDIQQAIDKALAKKDGHALINVKCYQNFYWFLLWGFSTVTVEGEVVRFEE